MKPRWRTYLAISVLLPIALLYPTLTYADLAGFGGYDGFASPEMMQKHGSWATQVGQPTAVYLIFALTALIWVLSLVNMPVAVAILLRRISSNRNSSVR